MTTSTAQENQQIREFEAFKARPKSNVVRIIRALHRDIGFLIVGLTLVYALSGVVLVYRNTGLLKSQETVQKSVSPNLSAENLGKALEMHRFQVTSEDEEFINFNGGSYNKVTGIATITSEVYPEIIEKMSGLHKQDSSSAMHIFSIIYGCLLLFLAVSSFWMYKAGTKPFKRGLLLGGGGVILAVVLVLI